jgi:hypothetical protein
MNDYLVTYVLEAREQTVELTAETVKHVQAQLPADADILQIKFLRPRGFSCHQRGAPAGR